MFEWGGMCPPPLCPPTQKRAPPTLPPHLKTPCWGGVSETPKKSRGVSELPNEIQNLQKKK